MTAAASRLQFQDYQFEVVLAAGPWKWTTRLDVSGALPAFQIRDVVSPYGLLRDMIPIPGEVVQAMSNSIATIQQSFAPTILLAPTTLTFTVDEGRGVSPPQAVQITNDGVFGSLLGVSVTSSAGYVAATPANVNSLGFNETGSFEVAVDSTNLLAVGSPYAVLLTVQDTDATNNPQQVPVNVVVRPKAVITLTPTSLGFYVTKPVTGPFPPVPSQTFTIQNTGPAGSNLDFQVQKLLGNSPWLVSFSPPYGSIPGTGSQLITVVVQPPDAMVPGVYTETLRVSGYSQNFHQDVTVNLTIS